MLFLFFLYLFFAVYQDRPPCCCEWNKKNKTPQKLQPILFSCSNLFLKYWRTHVNPYNCSLQHSYTHQTQKISHLHVCMQNFRENQSIRNEKVPIEKPLDYKSQSKWVTANTNTPLNATNRIQILPQSIAKHQQVSSFTYSMHFHVVTFFFIVINYIMQSIIEKKKTKYPNNSLLVFAKRVHIYGRYNVELAGKKCNDNTARWNVTHGIWKRY